MSQYAPGQMQIHFGPGPMTPAVQAIIIANIVVFIALMVARTLLVDLFGLTPQAVLTEGRIWQPVTYMFLHADVFHILFNMLVVWMFGVDLERRWGTQAFVKYFGLTGVGAGLCVILASLLPGPDSYSIPTIGASGAVYGLLMAWAIIFPHRTILFLGVFPLSARVFVLIMGAIVLAQSLNQGGGSTVSNAAHLGGLVAGYWYLKTPVRKPGPPKPRPKPPNPAQLHRVH